MAQDAIPVGNLCRTNQWALTEASVDMPICMKNMSLLYTDKVFLIRDKIILPASGQVPWQVTEGIFVIYWD